MVGGLCRQAKAGNAQEVTGQIAYVWGDVHGVEHHGRQVGHHHGHQAHGQSLPEPLADHVGYFTIGLCTDVVGHHGIHRHHDAHDGEDDHVPDGYAQ